MVTVCDRAHEELGADSPVHWSIPDPVAVGSRAAFDRAHDELATRVRSPRPAPGAGVLNGVVRNPTERA